MKNNKYLLSYLLDTEGVSIVGPKASIKNLIKSFHIRSNRRDKIKLDLNENLMGCSLKVIDALKKITCEDVSVYPEYDNFTNKLGNYLEIETDKLLITNGADDAIRIVMDTYLDKNDEVIIPIPTFYLFEKHGEIIGVKKTLVPLNPDLSFPIDEILEKITDQTKMVVIVTPNNPTGTIVSREDILKILNKARNAIVLIDEAYFHFSYVSCKDLVDDYPNLIIVHTFSKGFGLAGVRLGYIISNNEIIKIFKKVTLPFHVNGLSIVAGSAALDDLDFVNHYVNLVKNNRKYFSEELGKIGIQTYPSQANFVIANFGENCDRIYNSLNEKGILVNNVSEKPLLKGCLRIAIGTKSQMETLVGEIKNTL